MHPLSTVLFLLGYSLAIPIGMRMVSIVATQQRLAVTGHQFGVVLALVGWLLRGSLVIALIHVAWLIGVRLWFQYGGVGVSS